MRPVGLSIDFVTKGRCQPNSDGWSQSGRCASACWKPSDEPSVQTQSIANWWPVPLRLIVGYGFFAYGTAKLARGPDAFVAILTALGVPYPHLMAWLTIDLELLCGLLVLCGAFVALVSVPMAAILLVAMATVHRHYGFSSIKLIAVTPAGAQFGPPGVETDLLYLACLVALVL